LRFPENSAANSTPEFTEDPFFRKPLATPPSPGREQIREFQFGSVPIRSRTQRGARRPRNRILAKLANTVTGLSDGDDIARHRRVVAQSASQRGQMRLHSSALAVRRVSPHLAEEI